MSRYAEHENYLKVLISINPERCSSVIRSTDFTTVKVLTEIIYNILKGVLPLTQKDIKVLKKDKAAIKKIVSKKTRLKTKRHLLSIHPELVKNIVKIFIRNK